MGKGVPGVTSKKVAAASLNSAKGLGPGPHGLVLQLAWGGRDGLVGRDARAGAAASIPPRDSAVQAPPLSSSYPVQEKMELWRRITPKVAMRRVVTEESLRRARIPQRRFTP
ncbi:hypothetical protein GUJ93_ZPchr0006g42061 [Zizania palustris]|uniref:Uncharacterized protein n=1 Tax=Zizania palustris TaxID=103762 RepID=A0A8J5SGT7_ZIZPA|nr:hypothetical protein GUJ93_ZPchr0006g42061 [Zizania palustris]